MDTTSLERFLAKHIEGFGHIESIEKFPGGQSNPTFHLKATNGEYVLRQKPAGTLIKSAHAIDREYRVLEALSGTQVPVALPHILCEDKKIIGNEFYVMSYVPGRILWQPHLPGLTNDERQDLYRTMIKSLAAIHRIDIAATGLSDYGHLGNYFERQIHRWSRQYREGGNEVMPEVNRLMRELPELIPSDDGNSCLIHGDYRIDNIIFHTRKPKILAIIDWELSTLGHPLADLAYFCMCLRMQPTDHISGLSGLNREQLGIPQEAEIVQYYCKIRGIKQIEHWPFYLSFSFFRLSAICQGVMKRFADGTASSPNAEKIGSMASALAKKAIAVIDDNN
ncbi:MAG: phosphotransferase family protein [Acidiferrobacteraceae bacterium]|nr:phosphotransferase family protein [Acidiferrobacteraceae bacterium]